MTSKILIDEAVARRVIGVRDKVTHAMQMDMAQDEVEAAFDDLHQALAEAEQPCTEGTLAPAQESVTWRDAAIRIGEDLCSVGPFGYYEMTAQQWLDWALSVVTVHATPAPAQEPVIQDWMKPDALCDRSCLYACTEGFTKFPTCVPPTSPAREPDPDELTIAYMSGVYEGKKRKPLTDEQIANLFSDSLKAGEGHSVTDWVRRVEAAHGIKVNT